MTSSFDVAWLATIMALAVALARLFLFDAHRCPYCGARVQSGHAESCPSKDRVG